MDDGGISGRLLEQMDGWAVFISIFLINKISDPMCILPYGGHMQIIFVPSRRQLRDIDHKYMD